MPSPILPPELVEAIIDEVGLLNDTKTLRACALVASTFVFHSQSHLFRSIDLDRHVPRRKYYDRFHRLLVGKPHLGTYVRHLRLGDDSEDDDEVGWGRSRGRGAGSWITNAMTLPQTLLLLPRLEGFALTFNSEMTHWKSIREETHTAFDHLFRLPSLQFVSLEFISDFPPLLLLSLVGRLRCLGLSCVEIDASADAAAMLASYISSANQIQWESHLHSLFLRGTSPPTIQAISQALAKVSPPSLQQISITPTFEHGFCDAISDLMKSSGSNVTSFEWLPSIHFCSSVGPINLAAAPRLRSLRFIVSFRQTHAHGPFPEVLRLLSQASMHLNHVETVVIDCHCIRPVEDKARRAEWHPLDKMLSRRGFGRLRDVKIVLSTSTSAVGERQKLVSSFQDLLPGVERKGGLISVHTRVDKDERFLIESFGA
ncbi:hypothetical protein GALMADRAFT_229613 [Galerina marginata CBS 339.88]|uniref:F-box domain-containing protein n=1 Tax=Galerina marginata (strain CBS 339.88) TaxID=685588 RepID=A0A067SU35_GALM3|nr:hypothetical protein GALMADRAFT_229613 [Galerina marginata CBS 339.88]